MITVIGEAFIDLIPTADEAMVRALPGGRPLRVAVAAARLGYPVALMARLSRDRFGQVLRRHAARHGVDLSAAPDADEPATVAAAGPARGPAHGAGRRLYYLGTADWQWSSAELAALPEATSVLYLSTLACCVPPAAGRILRRVARQRSRGALTVLDVRAHPEVMETPGRGRVLLDGPVRAADVIRASAGDLGWLYPGRAAEDVARQWLRLGPRLVIISRGAAGALAVRGAGSVLHRPAWPAQVTGTAGAGDAFTAALLGRLHGLGQTGRRVETLAGRELADLLDQAALVAGVACERPGADTPTAVEVRLALRARPGPRDQALAR
jgi:fructokinase